MFEKHTFKVVGEQTMHCGGCERTVTVALSNLPDVKVLKADHKSQLISIALTGPATETPKVKETLDWIGYEVEEVG